ncbi:TPA: DUF551 domain-containing protein [Citrobacter freundii]|nr:DUF551 domain-containing protein [Citrobacter freundii]HCW3129124.1 DUF551 domain-containing protein [Citrobacter freundii]
MTTNHQANGPVSLDRLHQIREILSKESAQSDGDNLGYAMADAVKVIDGAIAAFGAAHVGEVIEQQSGVMMDGLFVPEKPTYRNIKGIHKMKMMPLGTKFYTAPPAPVSVPAAMEMDDDFDSAFEHGKAVGWNACRAAMFQAGTLTNEDNKPAWTGIPDIDNAINMLDRIDTLESCDDDRIEAVKTVLRRLAGNSPVTPDGYVMVLKKMTPEMMRAVQIRSELGGYVASNLSGAYGLFTEFWDVAVSAALQQEVRP